MFKDPEEIKQGIMRLLERATPENRRAVAWCGGALYAVSHNPVTGETHVDKYEKVTGNAPA